MDRNPSSRAGERLFDFRRLSGQPFVLNSSMPPPIPPICNPVDRSSLFSGAGAAAATAAAAASYRSYAMEEGRLQRFGYADRPSYPYFAQYQSALPPTQMPPPMQWPMAASGSMFDDDTSTISVRLLADLEVLWKRFFHAGTEMIITKAGRYCQYPVSCHSTRGHCEFCFSSRRMFPHIVVVVHGLEPKANYNMV